MSDLSILDQKQFIINKANILSYDNKVILLGIFEQGNDSNIGDCTQGVYVNLDKTKDHLVKQAYSFIKTTIENNLDKLKH